MTKLHEGLAIRADRAGVVKKVLDEARGVFKHAAHYIGSVKTTSYFDTENEKFNGVEEKKVDETVPSKIDHVNGHLEKLLDLEFQIDAANTGARADLIVAGRLVAGNVPVGFLLTLENKLKEYRATLEMVPTHAPGIDWQVDSAQSSKGDIYKSASVTTDYITKKQPVYTTVVAATDKHPAQVASSHEDVRVAKVVAQRYSATISPADKSDRLRRCDLVIQAAKRARQRANEVEIDSARIAGPLLDYMANGNTDGLGGEPPTATMEL